MGRAFRVARQQRGVTPRTSPTTRAGWPATMAKSGTSPRTCA